MLTAGSNYPSLFSKEGGREICIASLFFKEGPREIFIKIPLQLSLLQREKINFKLKLILSSIVNIAAKGFTLLEKELS